ncbi:unnamed protein product [Brachionus calyciflorus]|uniref:MULE transposase domain-containing protein n=1 Tax=Brachionus calyciflorus TaxID=104777 RepID=A0A814FPG3_9BILA|nr:unnamed protein product [Brachionus calyciflorus]
MFSNFNQLCFNQFCNDLNDSLDVAIQQNSKLSENEPFDLIENFDFDFYNNSVEISLNENAGTTSKDEFQIILEQVNSEVLEEESAHTWTQTKTQKGGYKVVSCGYAYTVEKPSQALVPTASTIYWKCEQHKNCSGRAISYGLKHPLTHTKKHTHNRDLKRTEVLKCKQGIMEKALNTNDPPRTIMTQIQKGLNLETICALNKPDAMRQFINRTRHKKFSFKKFTATSLSEIEVPVELRKTFRGQEFYWDDSGKDDKNRIIIFTTEENLKILDQNLDWYADGTFYIAPTFYKQIYTLHVNKNKTIIPCVYALLPNKKKVTYRKLFKMVKSNLNNSPNSINMDFEKAAMNAAQEIFKCKIHGCFFHLSQSLFRRVQRNSLKEYSLNDKFRYSFKLVQSLAFLPIQDVVTGFKLIQKQCPKSFEPILNYFESVYIGKLKPNSKTHRMVAQYPIETWNVFERVKRGLPRTNNNVDNWHSRIQADVRKKMNILTLIEILRLEQSKVENDYARLVSGEVLKSKMPKLQIEKEKNIERLVDGYNGNTWEHMTGVSRNFLDLKKAN